MKLNYFLLWIAGGGLVSLTTFACVILLRLCQARHEAEHQAVWDILIPSDKH